MDKAAPPPKETKPTPKRAPTVLGGKNSRNKEAMDAAGMKDGGLVRMTPKSSRKC
jgi:hypothetical protein